MTAYLIPYLKDETVLELDNDKLQLFLKGKLLLQVPRDVAYWKDIAEINFTSPDKGAPVISFIMKDKNTFGFRTRYIAADASDIYGTIMWYFRNQQNAPSGQAITNGE